MSTLDHLAGPLAATLVTLIGASLFGYRDWLSKSRARAHPAPPQTAGTGKGLFDREEGPELMAQAVVPEQAHEEHRELTGSIDRDIALQWLERLAGAAPAADPDRDRLEGRIGMMTEDLKRQSLERALAKAALEIARRSRAEVEREFLRVKRATEGQD